MIKIGYDPAPPGQYPIKTVIVDSDFDGVVSGAILRHVYPNAYMLQSESSKVQAGLINSYVDNKTAIVDLFYVEGCGLYFDHHESNMHGAKDFPGCWRDVDSAARVVYDYFRDNYDLSKFTELIDHVDRFDSGKITLEDFLTPNNYLELAFIINREDINFNLLLIELIADMSFRHLYNYSLIQERIEDYYKQRESLFETVKNNSRIEDSVGVVDMRNYNGDMKISGYAITSQLMDSKAVLVYKNSPVSDTHRVVMYKNSFNPEVGELDLLSVAKSIKEANSGGHKNACGMIIPKDSDLAKIEQELISGISNQFN